MGSSSSRIILLGTIPAEIPIETPMIPLVAPEVEAARVASPARVLNLITYSSTDFDPSEDLPYHSMFPLRLLIVTHPIDPYRLTNTRLLLLDGGARQHSEIPLGQPYRTQPDGVLKMLTARKRVHPYLASVPTNHRRLCSSPLSLPFKQALFLRSISREGDKHQERRVREKLAHFRIKELKDSLTSLGLSKQGKKQSVGVSSSIQIVQRHHFASHLKRMAIVVHTKGQFYAFVKGAPETIQERLNNLSALYVSTYKLDTRQGSYVLTLAYKPLPYMTISEGRSFDREVVKGGLKFAGFADIAQEAVKKRRRATKKLYSRAIIGATLEVIQKKRSEKHEVLDPAREAAC
ncbi:probable manganese-transporting ATPase PDR2 [Tanacetum coccineum]